MTNEKNEIIEVNKKNIRKFTQVRKFHGFQNVDHDTVLKYRERMESGEKFPPVEVIRDEESEDCYFLVDGYHRMAALDKPDLEKITVKVIGEGSEYDALLKSASANRTNGLQMTSKDIRNAISLIIDSFPDMKVEEICKVVGCGKSTVYEVKKYLDSLEEDTDQEPAIERVKRFVDTTEGILNYSNRRIAREVGVSEKTVRNYFDSISDKPKKASKKSNKQAPNRCDYCGKIHKNPDNMLFVYVNEHGIMKCSRRVCGTACAEQLASSFPGYHFSRVDLTIKNEDDYCTECGEKLDKYATVGFDHINHKRVGFCFSSCAEKYAKKIGGEYVHTADPFNHEDFQINPKDEKKTVPDSVTLGQEEFKKLDTISRNMKDYISKREETQKPKYKCDFCGDEHECDDVFRVVSQSKKTGIGKNYKFCSESCAREYADDNEVILDMYKGVYYFIDVEGVDPDSYLGKMGIRHEDDELFDPQPRPTTTKVTKDSMRVKPDVEKPTTRTIKCIPLENPDNIQQVAIDVIKWLGERKDAFRVVFNDTCDRGRDEIPW